MRGLLLYNGKVYSENGFVSSVYCWSDKIVATGEQLSSLLRKGDREIDLKGRLVLPGFTDCHTHFTEYAIGKFKIDFRNAVTFKETLEAVRKKISFIPPSEWITGWGWDKNRWKCDTLPDKTHLDQLSSIHPIAIDSKDGHSLWCNTMALEIGGLKDHATGLLFENEGEPVRKKIVKPGREDYIKCVKEAIFEAHRKGLTGAHICEGSFEFNIYQELFRKGELPFRLCWHFPRNLLDEMIDIQITSGFGSEYLRIGSVKIFTDGSLGSQTADMFEPYEGLSHCGKEVTSEKELEEIVAKANESGISCAVHAIGDRANHRTLNAFEKAGKSNGWLRNRIEHAQVMKEEDVKRFCHNNIIASVQPVHIACDIKMADDYWGKRCFYAYPFASLLKAGTMLVFGSDVPVESFDPFPGIYSAVCRKYLNSPSSKTWYQKEAITVEAAVKAYTLNAAYSSYEEHIKGSLSPGKLADMIVLDRDIFTILPEEILQTQIDLTIFGGETIFERQE